MNVSTFDVSLQSAVELVFYKRHLQMYSDRTLYIE